MNRRGWPAVAVTVGLFGSTTWGGDVWVASVKPASTPASKPHAPKLSAAEAVWKASAATKSTTNSSNEWQPIGPKSGGEIEWQATRNSEISKPLESMVGPRIDMGLLPAASQTVQIPQIDPPVAPQPRQVDPMAVKPKVALLKSAPPPAVVPTQPAASPAAVPVMAMMPAKTFVATDAESTSVWGSYSSSPRLTGSTLPGTAEVEGVPIRHGTYGSPSLHLSRDYHLLDACGKALFGEEEQQILGEQIDETSNCFVTGEYLLWWVNNGNIPVLASTATGAMFGYLGAPSTTLLLGPGSFGDSNQRNGLRLRAGTWLDDCRACGLNASFFFLASQSNSIAFNSNQFPTIARPFFAPNFGREFAELVAFPGVSTGTLLVDQKSFLWGLDVNARRGREGKSAEWFAGFRNVNLKETLTISEFITAGPNAPDPAGTKIVVRDQFQVRNSFYGGQIGGFGSRRYGNISLDVRGSIALGVTHQVLTIEGTQSRTKPGQQTEYFTGGLLAAGPNLGTFEKDRFSVVPEATLTLGYHVRPNAKIFVGYNFIGWTNVIRPGDQIDRVVDLTFVPNAPAVPFSGQPRPQPQFKQSDLVIQGITFGLEGTW